jgi:hypothetical protein
MVRDTLKVVGMLVGVTLFTFMVAGAFGGLKYLQDRHKIFWSMSNSDPLTGPELELIERLKESVEADKGNVYKYDADKYLKGDE